MTAITTWSDQQSWSTPFEQDDKSMEQSLYLESVLLMAGKNASHDGLKKNIDCLH